MCCALSAHARAYFEFVGILLKTFLWLNVRKAIHSLREKSVTTVHTVTTMSSSEENEPDEIDCDTCTTPELSELFDESLRIASEEAISLEKDYILHLDHSR